MILRKILVSFGLCAFASPVYGLEIAAKADGVKVFRDANKTSEEVGVLKKGQAIEALERKSIYWYVKLPGGQNGYVLFTKVNRLSGSSSKLAEAIQNAAHESRDMDDVKAARTRSAVMGVRGLNEDGQVASAGNVRPNMRMVYQMEDRSVGHKEINRIANLVQREIAAKSKRAGH